MKKQRSAVSFLVTIEVIVLMFALILAVISPLRSKEDHNSVADHTQEVNSEVGKTENNKTGEDTTVSDTERAENENTESVTGDSQAQDSQAQDSQAQDSLAEEIAIVEERLTFSNVVEEKLSEMTAEELAAQVFVITPEVLTGVDPVTMSGNTTKMAYEAYPVAGIVYSEKNYQNQDQSRNMLKKMQKIAQDRTGFSLFIAMSEEWDQNSETAKKWTESYGTMKMISLVTILPQDFEGENLELEQGELLVCQDFKEVSQYRENLQYNGILATNSGVALTGEEVGNFSVAAINAGIDLIYLPGDFNMAYQAVVEAIQTGKIGEDRIHNAVGRILTEKEGM